MKKPRKKRPEPKHEIVPELEGKTFRLRKKPPQKPPNLVGWRPGSGTIRQLVPAPDLLR
jgi:hypothetical protein